MIAHDEISRTHGKDCHQLQFGSRVRSLACRENAFCELCEDGTIPSRPWWSQRWRPRQVYNVMEHSCEKHVHQTLLSQWTNNLKPETVSNKMVPPSGDSRSFCMINQHQRNATAKHECLQIKSFQAQVVQTKRKRSGHEEADENAGLSVGVGRRRRRERRFRRCECRFKLWSGREEAERMQF